MLHLDQALKECADEIDLGTQYHLTRYAFLFESIVLSDASTLVPASIDDGGYHDSGSRTTIMTNSTCFRVSDWPEGCHREHR